MIKNNDAYRTAILEIERTASILEKTGGILGYGMLPEGNIESNEGNGKATFKIDVEGKVKSIKVKVHLSKTTGTNWIAHKIKY